jgi:hypothetical protein
MVIEAEAVPQPIGVMVLSFIEKWGMVAGAPDGEDSAGRSKLRLLTPKELVERAVETAKATFEAIESEGWVLEIPKPQTEPELTNGDK